MQFEFKTAGRIIYGSGKLNSIASLVQEFGKQVLVVYGCPQEISSRLLSLLDVQGMQCSLIKVSHEPTVASICALVELVHQKKPTVMVGIGGGSAMDSAKAGAALASNPGEVLDYLEVIGHNKPLIAPGVPVIAIPTTSGTGAEVTRNTVIGEPAQGVKVSLRSTYLLPRIALVDPELTLSLPPDMTANTGLDALTQLIEPYTCNVPNPLTDALCQEGIIRVSRSIHTAYDNGEDLPAREDMALASLFSGMCLANAKLGAVHGFAGPIGGKINAPHGAICARLLPLVMEANLAASRKQGHDHPIISRYATVGKLLTGDQRASATSGIRWVRNFCQHAKIGGLSGFGLTEEMVDDIVEKAMLASSMKGNPVILSQAELRSILREAM